MTRFGIDEPTLVHLVTEDVSVAPVQQLVAPRLLRSQALGLLFDAVIARDRGLSTADAEYLAVTRLQADIFVSVDPAVRARADGVVPVGGIGHLSR